MYRCDREAKQFRMKLEVNMPHKLPHLTSLLAGVLGACRGRTKGVASTHQTVLRGPRRARGYSLPFSGFAPSSANPFQHPWEAPKPGWTWSSHMSCWSSASMISLSQFFAKTASFCCYKTRGRRRCTHQGPLQRDCGDTVRTKPSGRVSRPTHALFHLLETLLHQAGHLDAVYSTNTRLEVLQEENCVSTCLF